MNLGLFAEIACLWEVTARKLGNVHRGRGFADLHFTDFLLSAAAIGPVFVKAGQRSVGDTILEAIQTTQQVVRTNTNLGIVLLLAPLAAVPAGQTLGQGIEAVLDGLTVEDSRKVFAAIRLANPGGLGNAPEQDVHAEPTLPLRKIMGLAADRDSIALQYVNNFRLVLDDGLRCLQNGLEEFGSLETAIIFTHLGFLARYADTLIARKHGLIAAQDASAGARSILQLGWPKQPGGQKRFIEVDTWMATKGYNPGTSADLVAATLFAALREGIITLPISWAW